MKEQNQYYWERKQQRAGIAKDHTAEMANKYGAAINHCIDSTKIYTGPLDGQHCEPTNAYVNMEVVKTDAVSALMECANQRGRTALLNFASYKCPGGGFIVGSRAQKEELCHESFLYNVLKEFDDSYYDRNRKDMNHGLYRDRALYSHDVFFIRDGNVKKCDVITCAAPNFSAAEKFATRDENNMHLRDRVRFVLEIAKKENVDTFIVGAWGCGVFKQDPRVVAKFFEEECQKVFIDSKIHLIFAVIPPRSNQTDNMTPFIELVKRWQDCEV
jgi:uncharacterized protein (TIGR02452 family)